MLIGTRDLQPPCQLLASVSSSVSFATTSWLGVEKMGASMGSSIRRKGFVKLAIGAVALIAVSFFVYWLQQQGYTPNSFALIALGTPVAIGLVGMLEVLMNRPFSEMEDWWNNLKGWQRGVLGVFVVIVAFAVLIAGMATAGMLGLI